MCPTKQQISSNHRKNALHVELIVMRNSYGTELSARRTVSRRNLKCREKEIKLDLERGGSESNLML